MVNMKLRKVKKNNIRNSDRTRQLKQDSASAWNILPPRAFTQVRSVALENKKNMEIPPVPVVKYVEIWPFFFAKVVQEHTIGAVGSRCIKLLEIHWGVIVIVEKIKEISWYSTVIAKPKRFWYTVYRAFKKSSPMKLLVIFSLWLSLFVWNFFMLLAIYIHIYLPIYVDLS